MTEFSTSVSINEKKQLSNGRAHTNGVARKVKKPDENSAFSITTLHKVNGPIDMNKVQLPTSVLAKSTRYSVSHLRLLLREGSIVGNKEDNLWFASVSAVQDYKSRK